MSHTGFFDYGTEHDADVGRGVVVDRAMRTSDPSIFAVGDVAEFEGRAWVVLHEPADNLTRAG